MPLRILKIAFSAEITTTLNPVITRLFHVVEDEVTEGTLTLNVDDFETDTGQVATEFPPLVTDNSYYNCYINGVLQMEGITTYIPGEHGTGQFSIVVGENETIEANTPIVLEIVNFSPTSTITTST